MCTTFKKEGEKLKYLSAFRAVFIKYLYKILYTLIRLHGYCSGKKQKKKKGNEERAYIYQRKKKKIRRINNLK